MAHINDTDEHAPVLEATEARQGRWGRHMLWVLLASLALVFIALMGTWAVRSGDLASTNDTALETPPAAVQPADGVTPPTVP